MFFKQFLEQAFPNELNILSKLPNLNTVQQLALDRQLHKDAVNKGTFGSQSTQLAQDSDWKAKISDVFQGKELNPDVIYQLIALLEKDIASHKNQIISQKTGSNDWHQAWINVYIDWIRKLRNKVNG